jgi:hypothetical protein
MSKRHLYVLALAIFAVSTAAIVYKWQVLKFPLQPDQTVQVWTVQAHIEYRPQRPANALTLQLPFLTPGWIVLDERFVARGYSKIPEREAQGREVQWATRNAVGEQDLYYRATLVRSQLEQDTLLPELAPELPTPPILEEPYAAAAQELLEQVRERSAGVVTFARELIRRVAVSPDEGAQLLLDRYARSGPGAGLDDELRTRLLVDLLAVRNIPARLVHALRLPEGGVEGTARIETWLLVHDGLAWTLLNPRDASEGLPRDLLLWNVSPEPLLATDSATRPALMFTVSFNLADAMAMAERRLEVQDAGYLQWSLLSLPLQAQEVYKVLLLVPVGAFIMLLLRNIVGIKTYGTFMPVLVALAFRETALVAGIILFVLVVGSGLLFRFYLERLRLLLVPRLTAILILVVLLMALISVVANRLDLEVGLSVALFPMVIMAMTIERMSVTWDERGGGAAIREGIGTMVVAALAYLVMTWDRLEHLIYVYPEFLLWLFAASLLLGRYSGYRLTELVRFRALASEADPIAATPAAAPAAPPVAAPATTPPGSDAVPRA